MCMRLCVLEWCGMHGVARQFSVHPTPSGPLPPVLYSTPNSVANCRRLPATLILLCLALALGSRVCATRALSSVLLSLYVGCCCCCCSPQPHSNTFCLLVALRFCLCCCCFCWCCCCSLRYVHNCTFDLTLFLCFFFALCVSLLLLLVSCGLAVVIVRDDSYGN